jgi:hypothetical protein
VWVQVPPSALYNLILAFQFEHGFARFLAFVVVRPFRPERVLVHKRVLRDRCRGASAASHAWRPDFRCNDAVRDRRARLLAAGQLAELTFASAVLFHNGDGFSSIRLYLRSSARFLVARITWVGAETRVALPADCECRVAEKS